MSISVLTALANPGRQQQTGISMLEVLIALLLMTVALLGATSLQITGLQSNRSAYYRSQASVLAYDIADRIRLNARYALGDDDRYSFNTTSSTIPNPSDCNDDVSGCNAEKIRDSDLRQWAENFVDVSGVGADGSSYRALLPGGVGAIAVSGAAFTISVGWDEVDWNIGADSNKSNTSKTFTLNLALQN